MKKEKIYFIAFNGISESVNTSVESEKEVRVA
jgi:hypothetical protein